MFLHFVLSEIVPSVPRPHLKCLVLREFWQLLDKWYATASTAIDNLGVCDGTFVVMDINPAPVPLSLSPLEFIYLKSIIARQHN